MALPCGEIQNDNITLSLIKNRMRKEFMPESLSLTESMHTDLNEILSVLKKYNVGKVILYGSVARGDYKDSSDLDICVEGLDIQYFFRALGECIMGCKHSVSVTDFSTTYGYFRDRILREGKVIYEHN
jgi:predicted nucleotidyltransferase